MSLPVDIAVYAEHSDSRKAMVPGWNTRVFNRTEVLEGTNIQLDSKGVIKLRPGIYHVAGCSLVTYSIPFPGPSLGWGTEQRPNGGYCRIRYKADKNCENEKALVIGTISNANMIPSVFETYLQISKTAEIVVEHQCGDQLPGIYLQDNSNNSKWHVFARISIRRI